MIFLRSIIFLLIFISSCKNKSDEVKSINQPSQPLSELKEDIINHGSIKAYEELSIAFMDYSEIEMLPYAFIMADKYDYSKAYLDVYDILGLSYACNSTVDIKYYNLDCIAEATRKDVLSYLEKAVEKRVKSAQYTLGHMYLDGKYYPKNETIGSQLIKLSESKN